MFLMLPLMATTLLAGKYSASKFSRQTKDMFCFIGIKFRPAGSQLADTGCNAIKDNNKTGNTNSFKLFIVGVISIEVS